MNLKKVFTVSAVTALVFALVQTGVVLASSNARFSQSITDGAQSVDVVSAAGAPVASPAATFNSLIFSFDSQTANGTLGASDQRIRVFNPTADNTWNVSLAATNGATAVWSDGGSLSYDFNDANSNGTDNAADADTVGGQLTINPAAATLAGVNGCATTNLTLNSAGTFQEGGTNSVTLLTGASGAARYCRWDMTGISLNQVIPAAQPSGSYAIDFTLTIA